MPMFADRRDAGRALAGAVGEAMPGPVTVIGVARGGVPVAAQVAAALCAPLEAMVVRKVGHPRQPELALGAVTSDGTFTPSGVGAPEVPADVLDERIAAAVVDAREMEGRLRGDGAPRDLTGERVVLVDDGVATGASLRAAVRSARARGASAVVVAAPVATPGAVDLLARDADEVVCVAISGSLMAVGEAYREFDPVPEHEVAAMLAGARRAAA